MAIVCEAVIRIGRRAIRRRLDLAISASAFAAIYLLGVPFPVIVLLAAFTGWLGSRLLQEGPRRVDLQIDQSRVSAVVADRCMFGHF